jgi:hypothetical protein
MHHMNCHDIKRRSIADGWEADDYAARIHASAPSLLAS